MACSRITVAMLGPCALPRFAASRLHFAGQWRSRVVGGAGLSTRVSWDDVARVAADAGGGDDPSDLRPYFERVRACNRGSELQSEFVPFLIEDQIVGYVHKDFINHLRKFQGVFNFKLGKDGSKVGDYITLHSALKTPESKTKAVADVIKSLGELIPGIRNELYPVMSTFGMPIFFSLERAAAPYFGIKVKPVTFGAVNHVIQWQRWMNNAYGVHMNGYVEKDGEKYLWIGKRSDMKPTYPGMLDHLVAGGLPYGITCQENLLKECEEEAGIPKSISSRANSVGAISYMDVDGYRYKRDVLFCYDLKLPAEYVPENEDGEVESFRLIPVAQVANIIRRTEFFKPNCSLVIIDFLFRHGYIGPDSCGYLKLLQSLRSGDCS